MKFVLEGETLTKAMIPTEGQFFDAKIALLAFMTNRKIMKKLIPKPLKPAPMPAATVFIAIYPRTNFGSVYNEAALSLNVEYDGVPGSYCLLMPVTEDMALILGREFFGFPKKIAEKISLEETDSGIEGSCVRHGVELINLTMPYEREVDEEEFLNIFHSFTPDAPMPEAFEAVNYLFKYFGNSTGSGFEYKPRLIKQVTTLRALSKIKITSKFDLKLQSSDCDFLGEIPVKSPILGAYGIYNMTMHHGEVLTEVDEAEFTPYAFSKIDFMAEVEALKPEAEM